MKKFNSQICTTKEQSKRLFNLGLKSETADMSYYKGEPCLDPYEEMESPYDNMVFPAWSLHRLIELLPQDIHLDNYVGTYYYLTINPFRVIYVNSHRSWIYQRDEGCLYNKLVDTIEWTIKNNFFNKEYLK